MPITRTHDIDDDGTGLTGTPRNAAWKEEIYDQIDAYVGALDAYVGGKWINVPFNAANFSAEPPLVWTVGPSAIIHNQYAVVGKILFWSIYLSWFSGANVLSGSPSGALKLTIPGGYLALPNQKFLFTYVAGIAGAPVVGGLHGGTVGDQFIGVNKVDNSNFVLSDIPGFVTTLICGIA